MEWMPNISDEGAAFLLSQHFQRPHFDTFLFVPGYKFYNKIYYVLRLIPVWHKVSALLYLPARTCLPLTWRLNAVTWYVFPLSISDVRRLSRRKNHLLNVYRERGSEWLLGKPAWVQPRSQNWGIYQGFAWIRRHDRDKVLWSLSS